MSSILRKTNRETNLVTQEYCNLEKQFRFQMTKI